jgi:hypothetical protein
MLWCCMLYMLLFVVCNRRLSGVRAVLRAQNSQHHDAAKTKVCYLCAMCYDTLH